MCIIHLCDHTLLVTIPNDYAVLQAQFILFDSFVWCTFNNQTSACTDFVDVVVVVVLLHYTLDDAGPQLGVGFHLS